MSFYEGISKDAHVRMCIEGMIIYYKVHFQNVQLLTFYKLHVVACHSSTSVHPIWKHDLDHQECKPPVIAHMLIVMCYLCFCLISSSPSVSTKLPHMTWVFAKLLDNEILHFPPTNMCVAEEYKSTLFLFFFISKNILGQKNKFRPSKCRAIYICGDDFGGHLKSSQKTVGHANETFMDSLVRL